MTKKDYIKIADVLNTGMYMASNVKASEIIVDHITEELCRLFKEDNSRFDEDRFKSAVSGR